MSAEVFQYPSGVEDEIKEENFNRLGCWFTILLPFVAMTVFLIKDSKDVYDAMTALLATILIIIIMVVFDICLRRCGNKTCMLSSQEIQYTKDNLLQQINKNKNIIASIDLNKPFKIRYNYYVTGNAIYNITQKHDVKPNVTLQFSSRIRNAERLIKDILKSEWPIGENDTA
ncbi:MAG: hypothetical protein GY804_14040 [Alphaproteobacteria bacterium]|nr:hypothetical protein [Alphaproteobacteria bacterium]